MVLDRSPSSANLLPLHEVAFPVHHHLNHLAFELVVSVVVSVVVTDLVWTPDADVLVPVLAHLASHVVLVLDETAVALDPFLVAVFAVAAETVVVAAVVSRPVVWVHHAWSARRGRLLQSSSASLASLALRVMPYVAAPLHT